MKTQTQKFYVKTRIALGGGIQSTHRTIKAAKKAMAKLCKSVKSPSYIDAYIVDARTGESVDC